MVSDLLHNPFKSPERYLLYGQRQLICSPFLRVAPKSYQQAAGEVFVTRKFLENICGNQEHESLHLGSKVMATAGLMVPSPFNFPLEIPFQLMGALYMGFHWTIEKEMANPNPVANLPVTEVPPCVRFCPRDKEVIQRFLFPKIRKENIPLCLIADTELVMTVSHPEAWITADYPYFEAHEYWIFSSRKPTKPNSVRADRKLGELGCWKAKSKKINIFEGKTLIGYKQKLLLLKDGVKTGWSMFEYIKKSKNFQKLSVNHLIYDETTIENVPNAGESAEESDTEAENEEQEVENDHGNDQENDHGNDQENDHGNDQENDQLNLNLELSLGL